MAKIEIFGRGVIPGKAEGFALVCPKSITGWGGIDPKTGVIKDYTNPNRGKTIKDMILVIPCSKGSNGWSCYFSATRVSGALPKALIISQVDSSSAVAATLMGIPTIVDFPKDKNPCELISNDDYVYVDVSSGKVVIEKT